jgi:hypothetical protein
MQHCGVVWWEEFMEERNDLIEYNLPLSTPLTTTSDLQES